MYEDPLKYEDPLDFVSTLAVVVLVFCGVAFIARLLVDLLGFNCGS